jgi:uncharacterized protein (TIGR02217 family)
MSNAIFPTLPGLAWSVSKAPEFSTIVTTAANGTETRIALWSTPRWRFKLGYEMLRDNALNELKTLAGFFLQRQGQFDSFLYLDPDDNAVTNGFLGTGDGTTTSFQCVRNFGGFAEPITNLSGNPTVFVNGVSATNWTVSSSGLITFATAPATGAVLTVSFAFYFRVRFATDNADFEKFMWQLWEMKSCELVSVK